MAANPCELCQQDGGEVIYRCETYRVVLVADADYPGFCRVIWNAHARELNDLEVPERTLLMNAVWQVEHAVREVMQPEKINLASLGNIVPHVHWHIIPRYRNDANFPSPIWSTAQRLSDPAAIKERQALLPALRLAITQLCGGQ
jgi:diadenosine tetraphosphate (Ap4A) HIT family hydrolase